MMKELFDRLYEEDLDLNVKNLLKFKKQLKKKLIKMLKK
jgi:hypothetical protein